MPYLQVKPTDCWAGDDPKTRRGVLKRRSIQDVSGPPNPPVTGKNLLAHKRWRTQASRRGPNVAPSGILDAQIFIRGYRSFTKRDVLHDHLPSGDFAR